jgi:phosphatidylinositol alpha-1,6-mannosyltransferase
MGILLLSRIFPPKTGGSGRWLWEIYGRLPREDVIVAAGEDPRQQEFDQTHDRNIVRVPFSMDQWGLRSLAGLRGYLRAFQAVRPLVRQQHIDSIHCACCLPEGWIALLLKARYRIPYMCYVHGEDVNCVESSRELGWMVRQVLKGASFTIANSQNSAQLLSQRWNVPEQRICVMTPGVDTARFVPAEPCRQQRAMLGWSERKVVLTVGRLQRRKGQDMMIRALPAIRRAVPNVLYVIVGDGEDRRRLEQLAVQEGVPEYVQFRGEPDDDELIRCYQQCDLFALPNRQVGQDIEGFGMVLVEAQACGTPVVAGASGGTAETMQIPATGRIVNCEQPHELAEIVIQLLADDSQRAAMSASARSWAVQRFDWEALSKQAVEIFENGFEGTGEACPPPTSSQRGLVAARS